MPIRAFFIYGKIFLKIFQSTRTSPQFHLGDTPEGKKGKSLGIRNGRRWTRIGQPSSKTLWGIHNQIVYQKVIWRKWTGALLHWWNATSQIGNQADYKNIGFWSCIASDQKIPFLFIDWKWCSVVPWQLNIFAYRTWGYVEPLGRFAKSACSF